MRVGQKLRPHTGFDSYRPELPEATIDSFMAAPSMGQFYNLNIRGSDSDGPYDCRTHRKPNY